MSPLKHHLQERLRIVVELYLCLMVIVPLAQHSVQADDDFFERKIRPILVERCQECHGDKKQEGGLRLTTQESLLHGGVSGLAVVPGKPEESLLIRAVGYLDDPKMPPTQKLADAEIANLNRWVALGATWPNSPSCPARVQTGVR